MRGGIFTMAALIGVIGTGIAVAGPATAVGETATCATVSTAIDDFSAAVGAIDSSDVTALAQSKPHWAELTAKFADAQANVDEGRVKTALNDAVTQLNRLAAVADTDRQTVISDSTFTSAMSAVDSACGF